MNVTNEREELITKETDIAIQQRIPCIAFIGCLCLIGIIGNSHVLAIFSRQSWNKSTYQVFVIVLSVIDLITCLIHMPMEVYDLLNPYTFHNDAGCKFFRFFNAFLLISSAFMLSLIAFERYRRICKPLGNQMTISSAKSLSGMLIMLCLMLASPMIYLNGLNEVILQGDAVNATGYMCFTSSVASKAFFYGYLGFIVLTYFVNFTVITISYVSVSKTIIRRRTFMKEMRSNANLSISSVSDSISGQSRQITCSQWPSVFKMTKSLFLVTKIFFVAFTPYIILNCLIILIPDFKSGLNDAELNVYNIAFRLVLINNAANPFVYGFTDERFRKRVKSMYCQCRLS